MKRIMMFSVVFVAVVSMFMFIGCAEDSPVQVGSQTTEEVVSEPKAPKEEISHATYRGDWSNNILSEAYYALTRYRTGSSSCVYRGLAMSDWYYVQSDRSALSIITSYIGSRNRGRIDGTWKGCSHRGGYCKFFVDLILYRSSYGIGNRYHLVLPGGTYNYKGYMPAYSVRQARPGWIVQRGGGSPHTAIVARNLGWGLDLIDSNWTGGNGNFVISRHALSWSKLSGFTAYKATYMRRF